MSTWQWIAVIVLQLVGLALSIGSAAATARAKRWNLRELHERFPVLMIVVAGGWGWFVGIPGFLLLGGMFGLPDDGSLIAGTGQAVLMLSLQAALSAGMVMGRAQRLRRRLKRPEFLGLSLSVWRWLWPDLHQTLVIQSSGGVFISYRRDDTKHLVGRVSDRLYAALGHWPLFTDVDAIEPGEDFVDATERAVEDSRVMLVVIGGRWLTAQHPNGQPRLHDPGDFVRLEVEMGLQLGLRIIPVLVDDAAMPSSTELPAALSGLARLHAVDIRHATFGQDVDRLTEAVKRILVQ